MSKIYRDSFRYYLSSLPVLLFFAAAIEIAIWLTGRESILSGVALWILAYFFHRHFLFDEHFSWKNQKIADGAPPQKFGLFLLITGGTFVLTITASAILGAFSSTPAGFLFIFFGTYLVVLSVFGTALPAAVARDGTYKLSQGASVVFRTMWMLVLGPGLIGAVLFIGVALFYPVLERAGVAELTLPSLVVDIILRTMGFFTTIVAVAVLCEMYIRTRQHIIQNNGSTDVT